MTISPILAAPAPRRDPAPPAGDGAEFARQLDHASRHEPRSERPDKPGTSHAGSRERDGSRPDRAAARDGAPADGVAEKPGAEQSGAEQPSEETPGTDAPASQTPGA